VFTGVQGAPTARCGAQGRPQYVAVDTSPVIAEKLIMDRAGKFSAVVPPTMQQTRGLSFVDAVTRQPKLPDVVGFDEHLYVATAEKDTAATINGMLASESIRGVVLSPGVYRLAGPIRMERSSQLLLGLGLATLVAAAGTPCVVVGNVDDVRISGFLVEASDREAETLVQWGNGSYNGDSQRPSFAHDLFLRVGSGLDPAVKQYRARSMLRIDSGHVVGDHIWIWRGDHTASGRVYNRANPCAVGVEVSGDDVTMYGLAVEHTLQDQLRWSGERGQVGVYSYFRDHAVSVETAIRAPASVEARGFVSPFTKHLNGNGGIRAVLNDKGDSAYRRHLAYYCPPPLPPAPPISAAAAASSADQHYGRLPYDPAGPCCS